MNCKHENFKKGIAFTNTISYGIPDFEGSADLRGQTFSYSGKAILITCLKCTDCGFSVRCKE